MPTESTPGYSASRPRLVKTLGILNVIFALVMALCSLSSSIGIIMMGNARTEPARTNRVVVARVPEPPPGSPPPTTVVLPDMLMMTDPRIVHFCYIELGTNLLLNGLMFAAGIGLLNLRPGARPWAIRIAWAKVGSSRVDLQACKLEYSIVSPK